MSERAIKAAYKEAAKIPPELPATAAEMFMGILRIKARAAVEKATTPQQLMAAIRALGE